VTAEKDASDAIRGQTIPDDVKVSPLDLPKNLQRFTPIAATSTLPPLHIPPMTKEMAEEFTTASDKHVPDVIVHQTFAPDGTNQQIREMKEKFLRLGKDDDETPKKDKRRLPKKPPRLFNCGTVSWGPNDDPSDGDDSDGGGGGGGGGGWGYDDDYVVGDGDNSRLVGAPPKLFNGDPADAN
jgi:hypothetical protein